MSLYNSLSPSRSRSSRLLAADRQRRRARVLDLGPIQRLEDRITPATLTWLGAVEVGGIFPWDEPGNWDSDDITVEIPTSAADTLIFPDTASSFNSTNNIAALTIGAFQINSGDYVIDGEGVEFTMASNADIPADESSTLDLDLSGVGLFTKIGAGTLVLSGTNTYTGATNFSDGTVIVSGGNAIPDGSIVSMLVAADLVLADSETVSTATLTLVHLDEHTLSFAAGGSINGAVTGTGGITLLETAATVFLSGNQSYTGPTQVNGGELHLTANMGIPDSALTLASGTTLQLIGDARSVGSLAGDGTVQLNGNTLFVGFNDTDTTFSGDFTADAGSLHKLGGGTLTLAGNGLYTGTTWVNAGTLLIDGDFSTNSLFEVENGATLGGSGIVSNVTVFDGGTLAPGNSTASLGIAGNLSQLSGSVFVAEINGLIPGDDYDQVIVTGDVDLGDATLILVIDENFDIPVESEFFLFVNDGPNPVVGQFDGLSEGSRFLLDGRTFVISYEGGDGNDVVLTALAAPEVALSSSDNPATIGETFDITVTVSSAGLPIPTGIVTLLVDEIPYESMMLDGTGTAIFIVSGLAVGSYQITADYAGDDHTLASLGSLPVAQVVDKAETTLGLDSSVNPSFFGQSVTFTASIGVPLGDLPEPTGMVEFFRNGNSIGTVAVVNGQTEFTLSDLPVGLSELTATYSGDDSFESSTSSILIQGVNQAETVIDVTPSIVETSVGQVLTFEFTVSPVAPGAGIPTGSVEVYVDDVLMYDVELDDEGKGSAEFIADSAGSFTMGFQYVGSVNFAASNIVTVPIEVEPGQTETTLLVSKNVITPGESITLTAIVNRVVEDPYSTLAGTVTFYNGEEILGTVELVDGQAELIVGDLPFGPNLLRAEYNGSDDFFSSTSPDVTVLVKGVLGDYDGDGIADLALYEYIPELGVGQFTVLLSGGGVLSTLMGEQGAIVVAGDFDGDGLTDMAVFAPYTNGATWIIQDSSTGERREVQFGAANLMDLPAPADYDGDGITDIATFRPNSDLVPGAAQWFILPSDGSSAYSVLFGAANGMDMPIPADYTGDGKADIATFRAFSDLTPGGADWFILPSDGSSAYWVQFGAGFGFDVPVPADYTGDGIADIATFRTTGDGEQAQWFILPSSGESAFPVTFGPIGSTAAPAQYSGPGKADLATFDRVLGTWKIRPVDVDEVTDVTFGQRGPRTVPILSPLNNRLAASLLLSETSSSQQAKLKALDLDELLDDLGPWNFDLG